ncbi:MAG TPA: choice-of-anchor tandem repeat GloVer-containing protein [Rhizomicrobium sp.]|nr:choice-of-anchor tandem repeat GloVer-containing protein [Rhizomicrobium sp.]
MRSSLCVAFAVVAASAVAAPAQAYHLKTLYSFCAKAHCADGGSPAAALLEDSAGNLYGTTSSGGTKALDENAPGGTVFELERDGTKWRHRVLHSFCSDAFCSDGATPLGGLVMDASGNLYGSTNEGGAFGYGTVFVLKPNGSRWKLKTLHDFCPSACGTTEGAAPWGTLTYDGAASGASYDGTSPLYGTTFGGGQFDAGTAFALSPAHRGWKLKTIYEVCSDESCNASEMNPGLTIDGGGNLYGTISLGGATGVGNAFELARQGKRWSYTDIYDFCSAPSCGGYEPGSPPVPDGTGAFYGTTEFGGPTEQHGGVVYKLTPGGARTFTETVVHAYCSAADCADGSVPVAPVVLDAEGNILAAASMGGASGGGNVTKFSSAGAILDGYDFCAKASCADGRNPSAPVSDASGSLFGTTRGGGKHSDGNHGGTVYELVP